MGCFTASLKTCLNLKISRDYNVTNSIHFFHITNEQFVSLITYLNLKIPPDYNVINSIHFFHITNVQFISYVPGKNKHNTSYNNRTYQVTKII